MNDVENIARLKNRLKALLQESISHMIGEVISEYTAVQVAKLSDAAYSKFYKECTEEERTLLNIPPPFWAEMKVVANGNKMDITVRRKGE